MWVFAFFSLSLDRLSVFSRSDTEFGSIFLREPQLPNNRKKKTKKKRTAASLSLCLLSLSVCARGLTVRILSSPALSRCLAPLFLLSLLNCAPSLFRTMCVSLSVRACSLFFAQSLPQRRHPRQIGRRHHCLVLCLFLSRVLALGGTSKSRTHFPFLSRSFSSPFYSRLCSLSPFSLCMIFSPTHTHVRSISLSTPARCPTHIKCFSSACRTQCAHSAHATLKRP